MYLQETCDCVRYTDPSFIRKISLLILFESVSLKQNRFMELTLQYRQDHLLCLHFFNDRLPCPALCIPVLSTPNTHHFYTNCETLSLSSPLLFTCHQKLCLFDGKHIYEEEGQKMLEKFKKVEICLACNKVLAPNHHGAYSAKRIKVFHNLQ